MNRRVAQTFSERPVRTMFLTLLGVILVGSTIYTLVEDVSFLDGLWWAIVTATTVGYGDISPETVGMRIVAVTVMFTGILTAAIVTASVAAQIVSTKLEAANHTQAIDDDFDYVIERVQELKRRHLEDEHGDDNVLWAAHRLIDAHRGNGSNGGLDEYIARLEEAVKHQELTDA